ncbi:uncharacterized protein ALTATR162_LOCUS8140 [Alternaria atra]|uniref:Cell cycle control protein cwf14 n=1 Tax=Alternaria atra TaxID=119953 RepID=A0A8J2I623_9PLEO|nr:uncharacterized protein ALTATR162_LOCUS8140 [Alternaria atra]CAG5175569.1 unnamed protein product [Alternaria atra]
MPPVRTARASRKAPPEGFDDIEDTLLEFQNKMKDAENASHEGKKKYEMTWPIFQITHQRSRYIYDLYYEKEAISKQLYDYLLKNGYADAMLIAKWKKQGYEKLCCTRCIQTKETNFRSTCICRVPRDQLTENQEIQCANTPSICYGYCQGGLKRCAHTRARLSKALSAGITPQDAEPDRPKRSCAGAHLRTWWPKQKHRRKVSE